VRWGQFVRRSNGASRAAFVFLGLIAATAVAPGLVARYDPVQMAPEAVLAPLSAEHPFGTDEFGRDIASRVIYGASTSLGYAVLATAFSTVAGTIIGVTTAYHPGAFDTLVMRGIDVLMAFPGILLALIVVTLLGPGLTHAMVAVGVGQTPGVGRVIRSAALGAKNNLYVEASRAAGGSGLWIMRRHLLPNIRHVVLVLATLGYGAAILVGASLSFLGLGAQPPTPEWGSMLETARGYLQSNWWVGVMPGVVLGATLLCVNVVGDQLRDILDPSLRLD
jgi:ABC-type dipeptide/oligopeptide/nickel transport system permease subunit